MKKETEEEIIKVLRSVNEPLTTKEVLEKVKGRCPDASMSYLVMLMNKGKIDGKWIVGKGYVWSLRQH